MQSHSFATHTETVHIRNMLCESCIWHVNHLLQNSGCIEVIHVELGRAILRFDPQVFSLQNISQILEKGGYSLVDDQKERLVEKLKALAVKLVFYPSEGMRKVTASGYFSQETGNAYTYLSRVFSEKTGTTLEKYIILLRIERVKELLADENCTLAEIAWEVGYSSIQYMSNQFRQVTGETIGQYRKKTSGRIPLNNVLNYKR
jgi:AraC family transcriptional regulator